jgi:hypothetical protein
VSFVKDGQVKRAVVLGDNAMSSLRHLSEYFVGIVERSTGKKMPVVKEGLLAVDLLDEEF